MFTLAVLAACSVSVTNSVVLKKADRHVVSCPAQLPLDFQPAVKQVPVLVKALPPSLDWLLNPDKGRSLSDRVLARLIQAEAHESDIWLRQDYRQAWTCVSLASKGNTEPFLVSSYQVYGTHPEKVWPKIMHNRRMKLGKEFKDWYDNEGNQRPDIPKKRPSFEDKGSPFVDEIINALIPAMRGPESSGAEPSERAQISAPASKKEIA